MHTTDLGNHAPHRPLADHSAYAVFKAITENFSELLIINLTVWIAAIAATFAFAGLLPASLPGIPIFAVIFGLPALWASGQTLKLAMTPKSDEVSHPEPTGFE